MRLLITNLTISLLACIAFTTYAMEKPEPKVSSATDQKITRADYLREKYGHRLHFSSPQARSMVEDFDVDCRFKDGRYLPLLNVLLARLSEMQREDAWMETFVEDRGNEFRIYDQIKRKDGSSFEAVLAMEINRWSELRPVTIRAQAIYNACSDGPYGRLWVIGTTSRQTLWSARPNNLTE